MKRMLMGFLFMFSLSGASAFAAPVLSLSDDTLQFFAVHGSSTPKFDTVIVSNVGTGTANFTTQITSSGGWLSATPASGSAVSGQPGINITIGADPSSKPPGSRLGRVVFFPSGGDNFPPETLFVNLTIVPATLGHIVLSPDTLSFSALQNGSLPLSRSVTLSNTGGGIMSWQVQQPFANWLSVTPQSGSAPPSTNLTIAITRANLPPDVYKDTVFFFSTTPADNSPHGLVITYTVTSPLTAVISLSPDTMRFSAAQGGDPTPHQILQIRNTGSGTMGWAFGDGAPPWLSLIPPGPAAAPTDVQVAAQPGSLPPGIRTYVLKAFSAEALNSVDSVIIIFEVTAPPVSVLQVSTTSMTFNAAQGQGDPPSQPLSIFNSGPVGSTLNWTLTSDQIWLFPANASGTNTGNLDVSVSIAGLTAGPYTGHFTVIAPGANGSPKTVAVNLNIGPAPAPAALVVNPDSLEFAAQRNQTLPPQMVDISNGGQLPLNWSATILGGSQWLSINPGSGTDGGQIAVTVATDLAPSSYRDTIKIEAPGAANSPRYIPVILRVSLDVNGGPGSLPKSFALFQNYPNPFNPSTEISFVLPRSERTTLEVFNIVGQRIRILVDGEMSAGKHTALWDGRDASGRLSASGIYFYRLKSANFSDIKRMIFLK